MSISLCLGGGGARGAFELGVLQYIDEKNIKISNISGSSIGSVIACSYSSGVSPKKILEIFKTKEIKNTIKFNFSNLLSMGIFNIDENNTIINELFPIKNMEDINKNVYVCVYDIKAKKIEYLNSGRVLDACLSSCALTPIFKAKKHDDKLYIDGGLKDSLPITPLLKYDEKILSIDLFPKNVTTKKRSFNPIKILKRKVLSELIKNHNFSISKSDFYLTNQNLRRKKILSFDKLDENFNLGYETAKEFFKNQKLE